jgi:hypothetical protein
MTLSRNHWMLPCICQIAALWSAWAVWSGPPPGGDADNRAAAVLEVPAITHVPVKPLQVALELDPAKSDPFQGLPKVAAVPVQPPAPVVPTVLPTVAPPPLPSAPPLEYQYFGRMTLPDGKQLTMLAKGGLPLTVEAGTLLDNGYVVSAVETALVRFSYPPTGTVIELAVPPPPSAPR